MTMEAVGSRVIAGHGFGLESAGARQCAGTANATERLLPGQSARLDYADRWMRSGIEACSAPGFFLTLEADMAGARKRMEEAKARGSRITVTSLMVHAVARALDKHSSLQQLMSNTRRCRPCRINIAVSVSGGGCDFVSPVVVIRDAASLAPEEIAADLATRADEARTDQIRLMAQLRRWGGLVPFAWLRRFVMRRILARELWKSPDDAPLFHVTGLGNVDGFSPMVLLTSGILGVGEMREKAVIENGQAKAGWRVALSCGFDHRIWGGQSAALFANEIKRALEVL